MNPNAFQVCTLLALAAFSLSSVTQFVPGQIRAQASSFQPRQPGPPPPPQQQQQQQPPTSWDDEEAAAPPPPPAQQQQPGVISFRPANDGAPKSISLSIGGSSKPATPKATPPATPRVSQAAVNRSSPATSGTASPVPPAAASTSAPARSAAASAPAQSASASSGATAIAAGGAASSSGADAILQEQQSVADEEALNELYAKEGGLNPKSHVNVVFIGHVDAGKSTLGGQLLYLTGMVDKRTLEKYEKDAKDAGRESWYLSWALDSTQQEREKGKTVETGRAYFESDTRRYTLLDAPGHKTYVPSMISGAAQADVAILVISARRGEFETGFERGGQTREHAMLVKTAGVQRLVVVINKMDEPTVKWDKERFDEIVGKLTPYLKSTGFNPKTDITYIPVSAQFGANVKDKVSAPEAKWYTGDSLLGFLDAMPLNDRKNNAPLLMPISDKYNDMGTIVVGKIESGRLRKGAQLLLMPNKTPVEVTNIASENEEEEAINVAQSGDNVKVRLRGVNDEDINVGFVLCDNRQPVHTVSHFEAELVILDSKNIICAGYSAVMHVHTLAEEITLSALLHYYDKKTGRRSRKPPQFAVKGQKILALIETAAPVCIETFKDHPQLGRFTLRDEGKTIAIGKCVKLRDIDVKTEEATAALARATVNGSA